MRSLLASVTMLALLSSLAGCGEREQTSEFKRGKYQGKPDTPSWENAPLAYESGKWTKGDRTSWEAQIRTRQFGQDEYKRISQ
jgi:hypothetical protein